MRAARAIVKTQIAGVTMCRHPHHASKLGPPCMMCPERKKIRLDFHKCLSSKRLMLCLSFTTSFGCFSFTTSFGCFSITTLFGCFSCGGMVETVSVAMQIQRHNR